MQNSNLRAFHLEKEAIFPRVIIDPSIISIFWDNRVDFINEIEERVLVKNYWEKKNHLIYYHSLFNNLPNDALFIDYLHNAFIPLSDEKEQVMYDFLKKNLYSEQKHQSKYQWLKAYYFECVKPELRSKSEMAKKLMQL